MGRVLVKVASLRRDPMDPDKIVVSDFRGMVKELEEAICAKEEDEQEAFEEGFQKEDGSS